jgi:peptidoglycan/xylan/chitin deacetylase (PgdA/CDA1 family)
MIVDFLIGPSILMYHSIADNPHDRFSVTVDAFREQVSWLSEHGFEIVPLSFLARSIQMRRSGDLRKKVVITFDDGYKDFLENALPILLAHGVTATVFLVTNLLGGSASWNGNASGKHSQLMSEDDVRCIKAQGMSLGSHTATHVNLALLNLEELQTQIRGSRDRLKLLGESFFSFAYPWGRWSYDAVATVTVSGYECAVAGGEQTRFTADDLYTLPRIAITREMDLKRFKYLLKRTRVERELRRRYRQLQQAWPVSSGAPANGTQGSGDR